MRIATVVGMSSAVGVPAGMLLGGLVAWCVGFAAQIRDV